MSTSSKPAKKLPIKVITTVIALLVLTSTVAYAASPNTLPTSPLYPVKKAWEALTLTLATSPETKAQTMINLANSRVAEAKALAAQASSDAQIKSLVADTVKESQADLNEALSQAKKVSSANKRGEILDEVSKEANDNKNEIEQEVEDKSELENEDKKDVEESKDELDKVANEAKDENNKNKSDKENPINKSSSKSAKESD